MGPEIGLHDLAFLVPPADGMLPAILWALAAYGIGWLRGVAR